MFQEVKSDVANLPQRPSSPFLRHGSPEMVVACWKVPGVLLKDEVAGARD